MSQMDANHKKVIDMMNVFVKKTTQSIELKMESFFEFKPPKRLGGPRTYHGYIMDESIN